MSRTLTIRATLLTAAAAILSACTGVETPRPEQTAPSYVAMEAYSGRVLYSFAANERRPIGMLANVATAIVVLDWMQQQNVSMNTMLTVPVQVLSSPRTNLLHLAPGDKITLRDALYSALMWDDSGCAITLAHACGSVLDPSDPIGAFTTQMNVLARNTLGMKSTYFKGPSGSVISQSSARDMVLLSLYAMDNATLRSICSQKGSTLSVVHPNGTVSSKYIVNSNRMLAMGDAVEGIKAARSASAGSCLMASIRRASIKRVNPLTGKDSTYPQRMIIVMLGMQSPNQRYTLANRFLRDGWTAWENWQVTSDVSDLNKFIILHDSKQKAR